MQLITLNIHQLRNLAAVSLEPHEDFNIILGENGSGKTSLLEAIYLLGLGRSFRTHLIKRVINYESDLLAVHGVLRKFEGQAISVGIQKYSQGKTKIKIAGESVTAAARLAELMPVQLMNNACFQLLHAGPRSRRQFIDWGLFHVKQSFYKLWKDYHSALKQRNAALKNRCDIATIKTWDYALVTSANELAELRRKYMVELKPILFEILQALLDIHSLTITYQRGWAADKDYQQVLEQSLARDIELGHTQFGAHRADILIKAAGIPVQDMLSRGQQKLLVCAMRLAQGRLLKMLTEKRCIYLVDDLAAELDKIRFELVTRQLANLEAQVFVTGIDDIQIKPLLEYNRGKLFHVKHGIVTT